MSTFDYILLFVKAWTPLAACIALIILAVKHSKR
jgi:hypothetical protein